MFKDYPLSIWKSGFDIELFFILVLVFSLRIDFKKSRICTKISKKSNLYKSLLIKRVNQKIGLNKGYKFGSPVVWLSSPTSVPKTVFCTPYYSLSKTKNVTKTMIRRSFRSATDQLFNAKVFWLFYIPSWTLANIGESNNVILHLNDSTLLYNNINYTGHSTNTLCSECQWPFLFHLLGTPQLQMQVNIR